MAGRLALHFDEEGDVLDISIGRPRKAITKELEHDLAVRIDPRTKEVIGFTILNFTKRFKISKGRHEFRLPIVAKVASH